MLLNYVIKFNVYVGSTAIILKQNKTKKNKKIACSHGKQHVRFLFEPSYLFLEIMFEYLLR
jgi:hypothetical protein